MFHKLSTLLFAFLVSASANAVVLHTIGVANDARDDTLRYIEHHQYLESGKHLIRYYDQSLNLIAYKELSYPGLPQHPVIEQANLVTETAVRTRVDNSILTMVSSTTSSIENIELTLTEDIILDAGFDAFIKNNWDQLLQETKHSMNFAVAGRQQLLKIIIQVEPDGESGAHFRIVPDNWLVRLFLPSLNLHYNAARQLSSYEGFSDIKTASGQSGAVRIDFSHHEHNRELTFPLAEWLSGHGFELDVYPNAVSGLPVAAGND